MIAVILIFYRQKDKHRTIMERKQTKRIIIFLLLLLGIILHRNKRYGKHFAINAGEKKPLSVRFLRS